MNSFLYVILEKSAGGLFMTWNNFGDMARGHWSQYSDLGCEVYLKPDVWERFEWFSSKRDSFHFYPFDLGIPNGEDTTLTWPYVTDIQISRYTFHRYRYGYQSLKIARWSVIQCSYDEHRNFSEVRSLGVTLSDLGLKFSHVRKRCINRFAENGGALRQTLRGGSKHRPPLTLPNHTCYETSA